MIPNKFFEFNIPCKNPSKSLGNIVFIHGYCVDHQYFIIRDELTKYFNYYSIDLPGHGVNDKGVESKDLKLDNFADYVIDYIKTKKLTNVILMGHSMGGAVVSLVASKAPELITKLVLLCPLNFASIFMGIPALYAFFPKNMKQKMRLMRVLYKDHTLHSKEPLWMKVCEEQLQWQLAHWKTMKKLFKHMSSIKTLFHVRKAQKNINLPTLLLVGKYDGCVHGKHSINGFKRYMKHNNNFHYYLFENSGHIPFEEEPKLFIEKILEFVKK